MRIDQLGKQPAIVSGKRAPTLEMLGRSDELGELRKTLRTIWVNHPPQMSNIHRLKAYRDETRSQLGRPIDGRRLCQESQAGKSAIAWRMKAVLEEQAIREGRDSNPYQVLIVTVVKGMTIKGFLQAVLRQMGDDFLDERQARNRSSDPRSVQLLEQRIAEWVPKLGVELLFVEEVQRLVGGRQDAKQVTDQFQTMLDRGVVPLVLMGTEAADELFEANRELRPRLGTPLQLLPVPGRDDEEAEMLQDFCEGFDLQLQQKGIFSLRSNLDQPEIVQPVSEITGGHVGRVARLFKEATVGAVERGAQFLEPFDLSNATRQYAIANGWIDRDPFSRPCP